MPTLQIEHAVRDYGVVLDFDTSADADAFRLAIRELWTVETHTY